MPSASGSRSPVATIHSSALVRGRDAIASATPSRTPMPDPLSIAPSTGGERHQSTATRVSANCTSRQPPSSTRGTGPRSPAAHPNAVAVWITAAPSTMEPGCRRSRRARRSDGSAGIGRSPDWSAGGTSVSSQKRCTRRRKSGELLATSA